MGVHPVFGLRVPRACPEVDTCLLDPRATWQDAKRYDSTAHELAGRFERNFAAFAPFVAAEVRAAGIHAPA
jgi:phosphoenolpyruvate carboxykinase (ATP)